MIIWLAFSLLFGLTMRTRPAFARLWGGCLLWCCPSTSLRSNRHEMKEREVENLLCRIVEEVVNFRWNCGCLLEKNSLSDWSEPHFFGPHFLECDGGRGQIVMVMTSMTTLVGLYIPYRCTRPQNRKGLGSIQSCFCHGNSRVGEKPWRTLPSFPGNFDSYDET